MPSQFRWAPWKPWNWSTRTWLLAISVSVLLSPFVMRWICLWQIADVTLPFDPDQVIAEDVPTNEDALVRYALALTFFDQIHNVADQQGESFNNFGDVERALRDATRQADPTWNSRLDHWLRGRRMALDEYRSASEMVRSSGPSLKTAGETTTVNIHQNLRRLVVLSEAEAVRLERMGDLDAAWDWHLANLRCARHSMMSRYVICYLIGMGIRSYTYVGIARWAEHELLTPEQLQAARQALLIDLSDAVPPSDILKANYLCFRNMMNRADGPNILVPNWEMAKPEEPLILAGKKVALWTIGQPDLVLRLARQELLNNCEQIDRPVYQRQKGSYLKNEIVFEMDTKHRRRSGQLDPARLSLRLDACLKQMPSLDGYLLGGGSLDRTHRQALSRRSCLDVALAAQQYQRRNGQFPASIEQLVPDFLDAVPTDPMDSTGAPLKYRRDDNGEAVVWSIGYNEIDDRGNVESDTSLDTGYRIRARGGCRGPLGIEGCVENRTGFRNGPVDKSISDQTECLWLTPGLFVSGTDRPFVDARMVGMVLRLATNAPLIFEGPNEICQ
ncbi:hypothetical protein [Schlesneria paludicola]|uniref:hypothetical protein n=1 Tax=Schlesneria paludicola TaxID=360056 RepID=UPI00029A1085|nr:hypothetical protein [Schlesneria paludicola]